MKKMLLINGSPRNIGASAEMLKIIAEKGESYGYECERVDLSKLNISHCIGCLACKGTKECGLDDDMRPLYKKFQDADAFVISVPIYFGAETGLLKNFIDRLYALMDRNEDGSWTVRSGNVKKGIVAVNCAAPDGNMIYHGAMTHLVIVLKMLGITDVSSGIVPRATASSIRNSPFTNDLLNAMDFQMSS